VVERVPAATPFVGVEQKSLAYASPFFDPQRNVAARSRLSLGRCGELGELWQIIGNAKPWGFARNINMYLWPDAGIIIQGPQWQTEYRRIKVEFAQDG
jgi:hypothetical protein